ncbi:MAG: magnesium transporter MgtE N-terminal domain-containing protein [Pyrinomonadaceae bacterium]
MADLSVALLDGNYPPVTNLFYQTGKIFMRLAWDEVQKIDWKKREIKVSDIGAGKEVSLEGRNDYVLLQHEILDALILDLQNRRSIRVNDLQLEEIDGRLQLQAADTSFNAILRRVSRGLYNRVSKSGLYDWKYVEFLRGEPDAARCGAGYHLRITRLPPGEIAQLASFLPYLHVAELLTLLPDPKAAKTLEIMPIERQLQVFEELDEEQATRLLALMAPDAAADLTGLLQTKTMRKYLEQIPKKQSERIIELLRYPENTVGGIMTNDVAFLEEGLTIAEARQRMRERFAKTDFVHLIYIVADLETRALRGMIHLRHLFAIDDKEKLTEIMDKYIPTLSSLDEAKEAAYRVVGSQLAAMPVTGANGELIGAVTIDAAIMQIAPATNAEGLRIFS